MVPPKKTTPLIEKIQTALISIATTAIIANCGFLFKVNAFMATIEQKQSEAEKIDNDQQAKLNAIQLKVADVEIKTIRLEAKQNQKSQ